MKKLQILLLGFLALLWVSNASAAPFKFNIDGTGFGGAYQINDYFDIIGTANITNDFNNPTPTFSETADFAVTGLDGLALPLIPGGNPFGSKNIVADFTATGTLDTTPGAAKFFFDPVPDSLKFFVLDGANPPLQIAEWTLTGGGGDLADDFTPLNGTITAFFTAEFILPGYFFDLANNDLSAWTLDNGAPILTLGLATVNASLTSDTGIKPDGTQDIVVGNNGQYRISVVPEPGTMLLLGIGLLGMAGVARRKS